MVLKMAMSNKQMEAKWQAEDDARTMQRYQEIMDDSKRKAAAIKMAKSQADDLQKRANAMQRVAKNGGAIKTARRK